MSSIISLSIITFKEGIRSRALFGIVLVALFLFGLNISVASFFMRDIGKVTVDMNLGALTAAGLLLVFFVGVNLMAKDIDRKTIHIVLSKPISRSQYIWGKFLGISFFLTLCLGVLICVSSLTIFLLLSLYPNYFQGYSWFTFYVACFFVMVKFWLVSAIIVFFSSITSSSLITLIFSVCSYVVGVTIEEVVFYLRTEIAMKERVISESLKTFIDVVSYLVPNFTALDFSLDAAHGLAISFDRIAISFGYAIFYGLVIILIATFIFSRREFN